MSETTTAESKVAMLHYVGDDAFVGTSPSGHALVTGFSHDKPHAPTPMELILLALGGCTGADVISILQKKRQQVTDYRIEVRAERRTEHPRIYTSIEVIHLLRGRGLDPKAVAHAIELSETKYCSVSAMLSATTRIATRFELSEE
jgi:putative redox protein